MAVKKYVANADTTITNAFKSNLTTRGTGSNMGAADSMEIFHIYGQSMATSSENSRILVQFPVDNIITDRAAGTIPASGAVSFYLRLHNAVHPFTVPQDFTLMVKAVSESGTKVQDSTWSLIQITDTLTGFRHKANPLELQTGPLQVVIIKALFCTQLVL
jgi:hypothetical protein